MIKFKTRKEPELFPFLTVEQLGSQVQMVKPVGFTRLIKEKNTGKIWVLKLEYDKKPYIPVTCNIPLKVLRVSPIVKNINIMLFLNREDLEDFEDRSQNNILEITYKEMITYEISSMYEAPCKKYKLIIYND